MRKTGLPPRWFRRIVIAPLVVALCLAFIAVSPALFLIAFVADLALPGSFRTTRLLAFGVFYLMLEVVALVGLFFLWLFSGFGINIGYERSQKTHYSFMRWWLYTLDRVSRKLFRIRIYIEDRPTPRAGPILVFCRHAGPGNSLLLVGTILVGFQREPRIVMLAKLQWEPAFDILLNRTPNRFIRHDPERRHLYIEAIGDLAAGLGERSAFVLFPEGKDFTPRVRKRAIEYLRGKGHDESAERAEKMEFVLPPRHNGVMAAIENAPDADIVFVAHSVLEDIGTFKQVWSRIPLKHPIHARYWRIPPDEVPRERDELIEWLYAWWEKIDAWVLDHTEKASKESV